MRLMLNKRYNSTNLTNYGFESKSDDTYPSVDENLLRNGIDPTIDRLLYDNNCNESSNLLFCFLYVGHTWTKTNTPIPHFSVNSILHRQLVLFKCNMKRMYLKIEL